MRRLSALLAPLRSRDFTLVWLGQSISQIGSACSNIALVWLLVGMTGSNVLMGAVLSASYIPTLLLLLFGGVIADRYSGRTVALISDGLSALATAGLATLVTLRIINLTEVFVFSMFTGLVGAFFNPALNALYPSLTKPQQYDAAASLRQMTTQIATLGGPALAGYLIAQWSVGAALAFDAASFAISFLTLLAVRAGRSAREAGAGSMAPRETGWRQMFAGFRFVWSEPGVLTLILVFSLTNGLNDVMIVLVPRLVRFDLGLSATAYGLLASCMGAGALVGAFAAGLIAPRLQARAQVACGSLMVFGLAIGVMGLAHNALTLDAAYAVMGLSFAIPEVVFGALLQRIIPADMRGRVYSLLVLIAMAMNPPGLFFAGFLGDTLGPRAGLEIGGGAIVALGALALLLPTVRSLNSRITSDESVAAEATPNMALDS